MFNRLIDTEVLDVKRADSRDLTRKVVALASHASTERSRQSTVDICVTNLSEHFEN